ncbi:MAG: hypothetical protein PVJ75_12670, partial [Chloroflexota bacterium]
MRQIVLLLLVAAGLLLAACSDAAGPETFMEPAPTTLSSLAVLPTLVPSVTPTSPPTSTPRPSATPTPSNTPPPSPTPPPTPTPVLLNGLPLDQVLVLPSGVRQHIAQIAERGRALGRDGYAFGRVGGSVAAT